MGACTDRPQKESAIQAAILQWLNKQPQCYARKVSSGMYGAGFLDIMGCHSGRAFMLEVKTKTGKVTPLQAIEIRKWRESGALVGVVRSVEDAKVAVFAGMVKLE